MHVDCNADPYSYTVTWNISDRRNVTVRQRATV